MLTVYANDQSSGVAVARRSQPDQISVGVLKHLVSNRFRLDPFQSRAHTTLCSEVAQVIFIERHFMHFTVLGPKGRSTANLHELHWSISPVDDRNEKGAVLTPSGRQVGLIANADLSGLAISLQ